jgi:hypothetical protein
MQSSQTIQHLKHEQIEKQQWDDCIHNATNTIIYAHSFYLDAIAPNWTALIGDNYQWVLPITAKKKYGIAYLYQPSFTQQLGVFVKHDVVVPWKEIIERLQAEYKFWEVQWNYKTNTELVSSLAISPATNFILDLSTDHSTLTSSYSKDLQRNLKRANRFGFNYRHTTDVDACINIYKENYGDRMEHVTEDDYNGFRKICEHAGKNQMIFCREATNSKEEVLAVALLLFDGKRLYNMMNTTTAAGRKTEANHFLLDSIIAEFSGKDILFDFEGSDLQGVKSFYENFGVSNQPYYMVRYNNLPLPLRWLKG